MTSEMFLLCLLYLFLWKTVQTAALKSSSSVHQDSDFLSVKAGDKLTLRCFYEVDASAWYYWYKQTLGQKPKLISTFYAYNVNGVFDEEFKGNPRFTLDTKNGVYRLTISDLRTSDSATYYCAKGEMVVFEISKSITVSVQGSGLNIHQSGPEIIQTGGSVTLNCTVHTGTCNGEHSVYWFKDSGESHPGIIYTHGGRNDSCERKPETQTNTCIYNLPMRNVNLSHAGTYYCAVASCGHILFGNGTKLDMEDEMDFLVLVYFLSGALTFTTILIVLLVFSLYKLKKISSCQSPAPSTANIEGIQDADNLHYAAISVNLHNRSCRQMENTKTECVYSSVRQ